MYLLRLSSSQSIRFRLLHGLIIILVFCFCTFSMSFGQDFSCDGSFYFVSTDRNGESTFYRLVMNSVEQTFEYVEIPLRSTKKRHITCLGYNVKDRMIYGLDFNSYELLRIGSDGSVTSLGVPENLDTTYDYYAGDMTADGRRLVVFAHNPVSGLDERVYSIRVNEPPDYYAGFFPVVSDMPVKLTDITVDPYVGVTYGFDYINGQIVETNRTGYTTANHSPFPIDKVKEGFGALFFDRFGQLYGLGSPGRPGGDQNTMYRINKSRGGTEEIDLAVGGEDTDGCGCPFSIEFRKTITPRSGVGCQQVTIDYVIENRAGIGQVNTRVTDLLPEVMTIKDLEMEFLSSVKVKSGMGSNILEIDAWTLVLGKNELSVVAELGAAEPGFYQSQAHLNNLAQAFGGQIVSDNPFTPVPSDATEIEILNVNDINIHDYSWSSCDLDTVFLTVPLPGDFLWSDGSTDSILPVLEQGMYSLTVQSACFTFMDSFQVSLDNEPLTVDLGSDLYVQLGDQVELSYSSNADNINSVLWSTSPNINLQCFDCTSPIFLAQGNGSAHLTITDTRGCTVSDEIQIFVDQSKQIFVPNAFTPNNDGINDYLRIQGTHGKIVYFKVFDRWGNLVHQFKNLEMKDPAAAWDGTYQGQTVSTGVYFWTAEIWFPDQKIQQFAGPVTLFR